MQSRLDWESLGISDWTKISAKWGIVTAIAYWGIVPHTIKLLIYMMGVDIVMGMLAAIVTKSVSSERSYNGLIRKTMVLILIFVIRAIGAQLNLGTDLGQVVAMGYVANEVISILENCVRAGIPVPKQLVETLGKFKYRPIQMSQEDLDKECEDKANPPSPIGSATPEASKA